MLLLVECKYKICMLYKNTFGQLKTGKDFQDIKHNLVDLQVLKKKKTIYWFLQNDPLCILCISY